MTIGFYNDHAFLIANMKKLAHIYACGHCSQQFTQAYSLQRHTDRCTKVETKVCCPGEVVERPESAYEKAFHPKTNASKGSIEWLEYEANKRNLHIHHALCGYCGERWIAGVSVDGYEPTTKTVFQYHGATFTAVLPSVSRTMPVFCFRKHRSKGKIRKEGYSLVVVWECERPGYKPLANKQPTVLYPHAIVYDFEAYLDKTKQNKPTANLTYENIHVPISVSDGDIMDSQPTHICNVDPKALIASFMTELKRRAAVM